jgi:hypothetical protein
VTLKQIAENFGIAEASLTKWLKHAAVPRLVVGRVTSVSKLGMVAVNSW